MNECIIIIIIIIEHIYKETLYKMIEIKKQIVIIFFYNLTWIWLC
jgi:hypothetical protein